MQLFSVVITTIEMRTRHHHIRDVVMISWQNVKIPISGQCPTNELTVVSQSLLAVFVCFYLDWPSLQSVSAKFSFNYRLLFK